MKPYKIFTALISVFCLTFASCTSNFHTCEGAVWGTAYHITYDSDCDLTAEIGAAMRIIDSTFSTFNPMSEVSRINRGESVKPSTMLMEVLDLSRKVGNASGGAFDPTVGPLVELWGFGNRGSIDTAPDSAAVASALALVGIDRVVLEADTLTMAPGMHLDFAAIAKGYGVDCVARALDHAGVENYMVEIGGEMRLRGHSPHGRPWRIQIDAPLPSPDGTEHRRLTVVSLTDCGVATSGNYRNFKLLDDGTVASHTISPVTGYPVRTDLLSATVTAPDCATADALATACMAMDLDRARRMIADYGGVSAWLVAARADSLYVEKIN